MHGHTHARTRFPLLGLLIGANNLDCITSKSNTEACDKFFSKKVEIPPAHIEGLYHISSLEDAFLQSQKPKTITYSNGVTKAISMKITKVGKQFFPISFEKENGSFINIGFEELERTSSEKVDILEWIFSCEEAALEVQM